MAIPKFQSGEKAYLVRYGHDQQEEIEGHVVAYDGQFDWWFIPRGSRLYQGIPVNERDLRKP